MRCASLATRWRSAARTSRHLGQVRNISFEKWNEYGTIAPDRLERIDGRLYKTREQGKRSLPVPPILDADYNERRGRGRKPKQKPESEPDLMSFESDLSRNLFARTLASPIRQCALTRVRLPKHFLIRIAFEVDREPAKSDDTVSQAKTRTVLGMPGGARTGDKLGGNNYLALSPDTVNRFASDKSKIWQSLVGADTRQRLSELTAGYNVSKHFEPLVGFREQLLRSLNQAVRRALKTVLSKSHLIVRAGDDRDRLLDVGMFITVGSQSLHVETLSNGISHFVWTERLPDTDADIVDPQEIESQTYGIVASTELVKLFAALDRRFSYSGIYTQENAPVRAASMELLMKFFQTLDGGDTQQDSS